MRFLVAVLAGAMFGAGLLLSGMTDPAKVLGFLDVTGAWDPTLAFVMVGAIAVHFTAYRLVKKVRKPLLDDGFHIPPACAVDGKLIVGAGLFGAGWGLAGFCPGPGLVAAASGATSALVFAGAMLVGMLAQHATPPNRVP